MYTRQRAQGSDAQGQLKGCEDELAGARMSQEPRLETGAGTRSKLICLAPKLLWMSWKGRGKPERGDALARVEKDDVGRGQREIYQVSVAALEAVLTSGCVNASRTRNKWVNLQKQTLINAPPPAPTPVG